jgi:hypothetical protein
VRETDVSDIVEQSKMHVAHRHSDEIHQLRIRIEQLEATNAKLEAALEVLSAAPYGDFQKASGAMAELAWMTQAAADRIEQLAAFLKEALQENVLHEGRCRQLESELREALPFVLDAGDDEDPEARARACELAQRITALAPQSGGLT